MREGETQACILSSRDAMQEGEATPLLAPAAELAAKQASASADESKGEAT